MELDFCLITSWGNKEDTITKAWSRELIRRGYQVGIVSPNDITGAPEAVETFDLRDYIPAREEFPSAEEIEQRYGIPSLFSLSFTEQKHFNLSCDEALVRSVTVARALELLTSEHSFEYLLQNRGPEIHRQLSYYILGNEGTTTIWAGFSPFKSTMGLTTALKGKWNDYRTIPYEEISEEDRAATRQHISKFRDEKRFYAHDDGGHEQPSVLSRVKERVDAVVNRSRPGRLLDQMEEEAQLNLNSVVNDRLFPSVEKSRQLCRENRYVFLPLQYPIESRLTVFSPQFFRQGYLIEYLSRILPSSVKLLVKPHPSHPGRPGAKDIYRYQNMNRTSVLNPDTDSHFAIEHSAGVVVTNNTVGFETLYYEKPLFTLGNAFYSGVPASTTVSDLSELPEILSENLSEGITKEELISSIHSLREASYSGIRYSIDDQNLKTVMNSVKSFIQSRNS